VLTFVSYVGIPYRLIILLVGEHDIFVYVCLYKCRPTNEIDVLLKCSIPTCGQ